MQIGIARSSRSRHRGRPRLGLLGAASILAVAAALSAQAVPVIRGLTAPPPADTVIKVLDVKGGVSAGSGGISAGGSVDAGGVSAGADADTGGDTGSDTGGDTGSGDTGGDTGSGDTGGDTGSGGTGGD